jgi:hypothetical protein
MRNLLFLLHHAQSNKNPSGSRRCSQANPTVYFSYTDVQNNDTPSDSLLPQSLIPNAPLIRFDLEPMQRGPVKRNFDRASLNAFSSTNESYCQFAAITGARAVWYSVGNVIWPEAGAVKADMA